MAEAGGSPGVWDAQAGAAALARLRREARRVTPEQWRTLFRQLRAAAEALAEHPFLKGDAEAERRLAEALMAEDLAGLDAGIDRLAEYVDAKLAFRAALRGEEPPPSAVRGAGSGAGVRAAARQGPSGDDFAAPVAGSVKGDGEAASPATRPRRAVLRL